MSSIWLMETCGPHGGEESPQRQMLSQEQKGLHRALPSSALGLLFLDPNGPPYTACRSQTLQANSDICNRPLFFRVLATIWQNQVLPIAVSAFIYRQEGKKIGKGKLPFTAGKAEPQQPEDPRREIKDVHIPYFLPESEGTIRTSAELRAQNGATERMLTAPSRAHTALTKCCKQEAAPRVFSRATKPDALTETNRSSD